VKFFDNAHRDHLLVCRKPLIPANWRAARYSTSVPTRGVVDSPNLHAAQICKYFLFSTSSYQGTPAVKLMVEALCYKPEGLRFESLWDHWIRFSLPNPCSRTVAQGFTQPLNEYQKIFLRIKHGRRVRFNNLSSVSRSRLWDPRHLTTLWYVIGIGLLFTLHLSLRYIWATAGPRAGCGPDPFQRTNPH
jgi:hypothetical protein